MAVTWDEKLVISDSKVLVGVISPSAEARKELCGQLNATQFHCDVIEIDQYHVIKNKSLLHRLAEATPRIIIIDMQAHDAALSTLRQLRETFPGTRFFVSSSSSDPKLILEAMRAGAHEFLVKPVEALRISQALERYFAELQKIAANKVNGKIYCVTSAKGGAGTTSIAVNLAAATAAAGKSKVALVDFGNPVGNIAEYLDLSPAYTIDDVIGSSNQLDSASLESYMSHAHGVSILPGKGNLSWNKRLEDSLPKLCDALTGAYDHSFIDIACSQSREKLEIASKYSSAILIVLTPELPVLRGTDQLVQLFDKIGVRHKLRLIVNKGRKQEQAGAIEIEQELGQSIFWYLPDDYSVTAKSINLRQPLITANHSVLASSYFDLAKMLTGLALPKKKRRFWGFHKS